MEEGSTGWEPDGCTHDTRRLRSRPSEDYSVPRVHAGNCMCEGTDSPGAGLRVNGLLCERTCTRVIRAVETRLQVAATLEPWHGGLGVWSMCGSRSLESWSHSSPGVWSRVWCRSPGVISQNPVGTKMKCSYRPIHQTTDLPTTAASVMHSRRNMADAL